MNVRAYIAAFGVVGALVAFGLPLNLSHRVLNAAIEYVRAPMLDNGVHTVEPCWRSAMIARKHHSVWDHA